MNIEEELVTYLKVLWRYKWMIAACAIIAGAAAFGISRQLTPVYSSTAILRVPSSPGGASDYIYLSSLTRLTNTLVEIANSDASLDAVAKQFGLEKPPKVEAEVVPETELITISASDPDPTRARDIANAMVELLVKENAQFYGGDTPSAREILEGQLSQARADLDEALSNYDSAIRCNDSATAMPPASSRIHCPNSETAARIMSVRQQIYADLLQKYETARTSEELRASAITVVEYASIAKKPATPKVPLNTALGFMAGLITGVILAFLFEAMDDTLRGIEDVLSMTALPIISQIPNRKRAPFSTVDLPFSHNGHLLPMPAFHHLSARLLLSEDWPKSASFLITSPEPGAGKSHIAANLSISLAEGGHRVVLVDMDFYRPSLHLLFDLSNEKGVSDYLSGDIQLEDALQEVRSPNHRVATAGSSLDRISEWLAPKNIGDLFESLSRDADYILIDAPAFLSTADPALIASQADAVILVVARRKTGRKQLRLALQQFAELNIKVAGIVLNRVANARMYTYYSEYKSKERKPKGQATRSEPIEKAEHANEG